MAWWRCKWLEFAVRLRSTGPSGPPHALVRWIDLVVQIYCRTRSLLPSIKQHFLHPLHQAGSSETFFGFPEQCDQRLWDSQSWRHAELRQGWKRRKTRSELSWKVLKQPRVVCFLHSLSCISIAHPRTGKRQHLCVDNCCEPSPKRSRPKYPLKSDRPRVNQGQKRKRGVSPEHTGKRQNLPSHVDSDVYTISYWTEFGCWPEEFFSSTDNMSFPHPRTKSSSYIRRKNLHQLVWPPVIKNHEARKLHLTEILAMGWCSQPKAAFWSNQI